MPWEGRILLFHALQLAKAATGNAWIAGSAEKFGSMGAVVEDIYPGCGPLAGIHAALAATRTELNLMIAVDMPFLPLDFLKYLIARARESPAVVVVPEAGGGLQPLCAVYRRNFAECAERSLRAGQNKIDRLFDEVQTLVIDKEDLKRNGFAEEIFRNLNTEQDFKEAKLKLPAR